MTAGLRLQLEGAVAAADLRLDREHLDRLDTASAPAPGFSASLTAPFVRRMVMGGHDVAGWNG